MEHININNIFIDILTDVTPILTIRNSLLIKRLINEVTTSDHQKILVNLNLSFKILKYYQSYGKDDLKEALGFCFKDEVHTTCLHQHQEQPLITSNYFKKILGFYISNIFKVVHQEQSILVDFYECFKEMMNREDTSKYISTLNKLCCNNIVKDVLIKYFHHFCRDLSMNDCSGKLIDTYYCNLIQFYDDLQLYCIEWINNDDIISNRMRAHLILQILQRNTSFISNLSKYHQCILELFLKELPTYENYFYGNLYQVYKYFSDRFDINDKNKELINNNNNRNNNIFKFIFYKFYKPIDIFKEIFCKLGIITKYHVCMGLDKDQLLLESSIDIIIQSLSTTFTIDSIIIICIYYSKSISLPTRLYNSILKLVLESNFSQNPVAEGVCEMINRLDDFELLIVNSLESLFEIYGNNKFLELLFHLYYTFFYQLPSDLILSNLNKYSKQFKEMILDQKIFLNKYKNFHFWILAANHFTQDQVRLFIKYFGSISKLVYKENYTKMIVDFIDNSDSPIESIKFYIDMFRLDTKEPDEPTYKEILQWKNIENIKCFLENFFIFGYEHLLQEVVTPNSLSYRYILLMFERARHEDPLFLSTIIDQIKHFETTRIIYSYHSTFKTFIDLFNLNSKCICIKEERKSNQPSHLSYLLMNEIIKQLLIGDDNQTMKSILELSLVSHQFHKICSSIISNYPLKSIRIYQNLDYIGSQYCLFQKPPMHIHLYDLVYIPTNQFPRLLDNLVSLVQPFSIISKHDFSTIMINTKRLEYIRFSMEDPTTKLIDRPSTVKWNELLEMQFIIKRDCCGNFDRYNKDGLPKVGNNDRYKLDIHFFKIFIDHYMNNQLKTIDLQINAKLNKHSTTLFKHCLPILSTLQSSNNHRCNVLFNNWKSTKGINHEDLQLIKEINLYSTDLPTEKEIDLMLNLEKVTIIHESNDLFCDQVNLILSKESLKYINIITNYISCIPPILNHTLKKKWNSFNIIKK